MSELSELLKPVEAGKRELTITMIDGQRPVVIFNGFWNGKFIKAAMDSISKAYRLRARDIVRPRAQIEGKVTQQ